MVGFYTLVLLGANGRRFWVAEFCKKILYHLGSVISCSRTRTNLCNVIVLNKFGQSPFYCCFADIGTGMFHEIIGAVATTVTATMLRLLIHWLFLHSVYL